MLPFGVNRLEQRRTLQRNAAKPFLQEFSFIPKLRCEYKRADLDRRLPDTLSPQDFAGLHSQNTDLQPRKNELFSQSDRTTSNRNWPKNRSYRKQTAKACLTGTRIALWRFTKLPQFHPGKPARISATHAKIAKHSLLLSPRNFIGLQDRDCRSVRLTVSAQK